MYLCFSFLFYILAGNFYVAEPFKYRFLLWRQFVAATVGRAKYEHFLPYTGLCMFHAILFVADWPVFVINSCWSECGLLKNRTAFLDFKAEFYNGQHATIKKWAIRALQKLFSLYADCMVKKLFGRHWLSAGPSPPPPIIAPYVQSWLGSLGWDRKLTLKIFQRGW